MWQPPVHATPSPSGGEVGAGIEQAIGDARGGGRPIAEHLREPFEQALGADLVGVRVHTDAKADQLNRSIEARAFTVGRDIFFGRGEYDPGSRAGQELLAHELTHVVQQRGAGASAANGAGESIGTCIQRKKTIILKQGNTDGGFADLESVGAHGYGQGMTAMLYSWNHISEGSKPTVKPPGYPAGVPWFQSYMVQGHLLNENLGGPGNDLENLAPITKKTNSRHLHAVENKAKDMVVNKDENAMYAVEVVAGKPNPQNFPNYPQDQASLNYFSKLPRGFKVVLLDGNAKVLVDEFIENSDV